MYEKICANCEEETDRLFDSPLIDLPFDLSKYQNGDEFDSDFSASCLITYFVVETANGKFVRFYDAVTEPVCLECYDHAVTPNLYKYIHNKPPEIYLDGWKTPEWRTIL